MQQEVDRGLAMLEAEAFDDDASLQSTHESSDHSPSSASTKVGSKAQLGSKVVYIILFVAALAFGLATYFVLDSAQEQEFTTEFESYARETTDIAEGAIENTFGQMRTLATAITATVNDRSFMSFPNVTVPFFDLRTNEISELTGAEMFLYIPFVENQDRASWETFAVENQNWAHEGHLSDHAKTETEPIRERIYPMDPTRINLNETRRGFVDNGFVEEVLDGLNYTSSNFSVPVAMYGPKVQNSSLAMLDLFTHPIFRKEVVSSLEYDVPVISEAMDLQFLLDHVTVGENTRNDKRLRSFTLNHVKEDFNDNPRTVGFVMAVVPWDTFFKNLLVDGIGGIVVMVTSDCGSNITLVVNGEGEIEQDYGEWVSSPYRNMATSSRFFWKEHPSGTSRHCHFDLVVFPTESFHEQYKSGEPVIYAAIVVSVFAFTALVFLVYDVFLSQRQSKVMRQAARAEAVVTSLFPKEVGHRLIAEADSGGKGKERDKRKLNGSSLDNILEGRESLSKTSKPIADLFTESTTMFADISGFTAWSSLREPTQVFRLLETVYKTFDELAKKRKVFKIETVGDCYVCATGLPEPMKDHHLAMTRFARDILIAFEKLMEELATELGPDTTQLGIRIGIHSGPVTGGVMRGDRARFQLFGDTVNTAARMESTGSKNRIHLSAETALLLEGSEKGHWIEKRADLVTAKGKGDMQTYWLRILVEEDGSQTEKSISSDEVTENPSVQNNDKTKLVNYNVDVLAKSLKAIRAARVVKKRDQSFRSEQGVLQEINRDSNFLDEVVEIIPLPEHDGSGGHSYRTQQTDLPDIVMEQLRKYVTMLSSMYRPNAFHGFEHASHVNMSVTKLLGRIVPPPVVLGNESSEKILKDPSYGLSDPLTHFACSFGALIHDVDHRGLTNLQLVGQQDPLAINFNNRSVAEQNSLQLSWELLMHDCFNELRRAIYSNDEELRRFRQLLVNIVMATDIVDKDLKKLRNDRWKTAFDQSSRIIEEKPLAQRNRVATIVLEHLIQASDVSHTMQHWHIYCKWNERFFFECYQAFLDGHADKDPSETWFEGELGFFDFYIIPLAMKLKECGVFGVSSEEYLSYARANRMEWERKGRKVVAEYKEKARSTLRRASAVG